jgi:hypothetical protein
MAAAAAMQHVVLIVNRECIRSVDIPAYINLLSAMCTYTIVPIQIMPCKNAYYV